MKTCQSIRGLWSCPPLWVYGNNSLKLHVKQIISNCWSGGKAVAFKTRDLRFKSRHGLILFTINRIKMFRQKWKRGRKWPECVKFDLWTLQVSQYGMIKPKHSTTYTTFSHVVTRWWISRLTIQILMLAVRG